MLDISLAGMTSDTDIRPSDFAAPLGFQAAFVSKQPERLVLLIGTKAGTVGMPSYTAG